MKAEWFSIHPLGGIDSRHNAPIGTAERVVNMRRDGSGAWKQSGGFRSIFDSNYLGGGDNYFDSVSAGQVHSLHIFIQDNGARRWLMWEMETAGTLFLMYAIPSSGGGGTLQSGRSFARRSAGTQYLDIGRWCYIYNGLDQPVRWDGVQLLPIGFPRKPPAPEIVGETREQSFYYDPPDVVEGSSLATPKSYGGDDATEANNDWQLVENNVMQRGVGPRATDHDGTLDAGTERWHYGYRVTYLNDLGQESPPSDPVYVAGLNYGLADNTTNVYLNETGGGKKTIIGALAQPPDNVRGIRLWRTANLDGIDVSLLAHQAYYLHTEFGAALDFQFADDLSDDELGVALDDSQLGTMPIGFRYAAMFKGTLFVSGMQEYPDRVHHSAPGLPEQMPPLNYFSIGDAAGGEMTGMRATKNALVVFKTRGIYLIKGDPVQGFVAETLTEDTGNLSPNAIREVPGLGLMFVSRDGPMLLEGALENTGSPTRVVDLSAPIRELWDREVTKASLVKAVADVVRSEREVWVQVPAWGSDQQKLGFVYHYEDGYWSVREEYPASCMAALDDHRGYLYFGSWDDTNHPGVWVYRPNTLDMDGTAVSAEWRSNPIDFGSRWGRSTVMHLQPIVDGVGDRSITVQQQVDRRHGWTASSQSQDGEDQEAARPKWGTDSWSTTATWSDYDPTPVRFDAQHENQRTGSAPMHMGANCFEYQFSLTCPRMALYGVDIAIDKGKGKGLRKLNEVLAPSTRGP